MTGGRSARVVRRLREVGLRGLERRLTQPARDAARHRALDAWRGRWGAQDPYAAERLLAAVRPEVQPASAPGEAPPLVRLRDRLGAGAFYADFAGGVLRRELAARRPDAASALVEQAERALAGDLEWVVPGGGPDWHAALPDGGRWPLGPSHEVGIEAERPVGDVRLSWELGRCPHLVRLAQAAWLTGEERFAAGAVALMRSWAEANPPGLGIAWAHAQEVGLRAAAWLWAFHLLRGERAFDAEAFRIWLGVVLAHAELLHVDLSDTVITHNHLVSELGALALLGLALPELRDAEAWRRRGIGLLEREVRKQIDDEGVQGEQSTHYHAFVCDSLVAVDVLARRQGRPLAADVRARIAGGVDFVTRLLRPDGTLPPIGDTDAGRAFRLGPDPLDRRDLVAAAALAFGRSDWGEAAGDAAGALWLTGGQRIPGAARMRSPLESRVLAGAWSWRAAGIATARDGLHAAAESVVFRAGATGFLRDVPVNHAHADALSVTWRLGGADVLIDPGTWIYSETAGWRAALRSTAAHATVRLDGRDQADVSTWRFGVEGLRPARWVAFEGDAGHLDATAEHPAEGAPRVRRRVVWIRGGVLLLVDRIDGDGAHEVESWLPMSAARGEACAGGATLALENGVSLRVQVEGDVETVEVVRPGPGDPPGPGWWCPRYGLRRPGTALRVGLGKRTLPAVLATLLQARRDGPIPEPGELEIAGDGAVRALVAGGRLDVPSDPGLPASWTPPPAARPRGAAR